MNHCFVIEGGVPLKGEIWPSGNKNAALPTLAATLLTDEPVILRNLPAIRDVEVMAELLQVLGAHVERLDPKTWKIHARQVCTPRTDMDRELFRAIRGSIMIAGPLLARLCDFSIPAPGGDVIGRRRVDTHFLAFRELGADVDVQNGNYVLKADRLAGADILLDEASVTGTENAVMAAVFAKGTTILRNAASEPHVQDLCTMLNAMGAHISGIGTNTLVIEGVERLHGVDFTIASDHIEVGSYIALAAATRGELLIHDAVPHHLRMTLMQLERLGVSVEVRGDALFVPAAQSLKIVPDMGGAIPSIADAPWPAFPADLMSIALVLATQSDGVIIFHEKMFESRLFFVDKLIPMGARIVLCDPHRALVYGPSRLHGDEMESPDIRAGMAMLIAALAAEGTSTIFNIRQIDRGYERIEEKLRPLGARIERRQVGT
ncbi:MAG TPA: UDP-N-acetylglucosamine 1-carboxyvinyltransferase [Anaerolineae bacterium]|nr:UDP-N-acetylglucosamine 1-carboxyvinyltransferase [Anaerolineae bacterium]HQK13694.1 UDP-N-acetylglucosamine 1-carboxyvinyltransferase [Anaerolineae bacterium]